VKNHEWFDDIDFEKLYNQNLIAPYTPTLLEVDEEDVRIKMERPEDPDYNGENVYDLM
jgi:ABC-type transporter MlaC component